MHTEEMDELYSKYQDRLVRDPNVQAWKKFKLLLQNPERFSAWYSQLPAEHPQIRSSRGPLGRMLNWMARRKYKEAMKARGAELLDSVERPEKVANIDDIVEEIRLEALKEAGIEENQLPVFDEDFDDQTQLQESCGALLNSAS